MPCHLDINAKTYETIVYGLLSSIIYGKVFIPCAADYGKAKHLHPEDFDVQLYKKIILIWISMYPRAQQKAKHEVSDEYIKKSVLIVTLVEDLINPIKEHFKAGFRKIYLQNTVPDEMDSIQIFTKALPFFKGDEIP